MSVFGWKVEKRRIFETFVVVEFLLSCMKVVRTLFFFVVVLIRKCFPFFLLPFNNRKNLTKSSNFLTISRVFKYFLKFFYNFFKRKTKKWSIFPSKISLIFSWMVKINISCLQPRLLLQFPPFILFFLSLILE